jgi:hypothetical protein
MMNPKTGLLYMWWTAVESYGRTPVYVVDSNSWVDDESYGRPVYVVDSSSWKEDESYGKTPLYVVDSSSWEDDESYGRTPIVRMLIAG